MGKSIMKIIEYFNGWKTIIAYLLAQIPFLGGHPMLYDAVIALFNGFGSWPAVLIQLLLALGLIHKGQKELLK